MAGQDQGDNESVEAFVNRRQRAAAALAFARATAHQAYGQDIRNGQSLGLQRPADLADYGLRLSAVPANPAPSAATSPSAADDSPTAADPLLPVDAAIRSAANTATFGGADKFAAAMDALIAPGGLGGWGQRYDANLQQQQARDRYEAAHAQLAQSVGSVGGGLLGLFALGPEDLAAAAPRLAGAAKLTAKEAGGILGAGALAGLGSQTLSDIATGHRSSPGDVVGAVAGGVAGVAALPLGPGRAGAVDGAVTSATQDLFNGRPVSIPQAAQSAIGGGLLGKVAGSAGRNWANGLSTQAKGRLGETLGDMRSEFNGEPRWQGPKVRAPLSPGQTAPLKGKGSYWVPDGLGGSPPTNPSQPRPDMFEDKFGYGADTSNNQKIAQTNFGTKFRLNHFTPSDVGMMTAFPFLGVAPQVVRQDQGQ